MEIKLAIAVLLSAVYLIFPSLFNPILDLIRIYISKLWGWILELVLLIAALVNPILDLIWIYISKLWGWILELVLLILDLIWIYVSKLWRQILELALIIAVLFVFWGYILKSRDFMGNLIKILVMLGYVLFISIFFGESSLLVQFIDFVLTELGLKNLGIGYIIGSVLAFSGVLYGLHLRNKQLEAFSNRNVEDRFIRSVDLIGKKEQASRLGGLVGLDTLMYENVDLYERVLNYLGKFLRSPPDLDGWKWKWESESESSIYLNNTLRCWQTSDKQDAKSPDKQDAKSPDKQDTDSFNKKEPEGVLIGERPDIKYIVQILQDKSEKGEQLPEWMKEEKVPISFDEVHLEGANLTKINLKNAKLARANLEKTYLIEVNLEGANLSQANLKGANLFQANLKGTNLFQANLLNTNITGTNITGTDLRETKNLTKEQFKGCYYVEKPPLLPSGWDAEQLGIKKLEAE